MELHQFTNGIEDHKSEMAKVIDNFGLYTNHEDGYSYTVGLHNLGLPELIVFGQNPNVAEELFEILHHCAREGLIEFSPGIGLDNILSPGPSLHDYPNEKKVTQLYAARNFFGTWEFDVIEVRIEKMDMKVNEK